MSSPPHAFGRIRQRKKVKGMDAPAKVGLSDQVSKKPNQMSGGEMAEELRKRYAIVNNPKILLADEPTGRGRQQDRRPNYGAFSKRYPKSVLVILVTHNQELADMYADRIIRMQDGLIVSDQRLYGSTRGGGPRALKEEEGQDELCHRHQA